MIKLSSIYNFSSLSILLRRKVKTRPCASLLYWFFFPTKLPTYDLWSFQCIGTKVITWNLLENMLATKVWLLGNKNTRIFFLKHTHVGYSLKPSPVQDQRWNWIVDSDSQYMLQTFSIYVLTFVFWKLSISLMFSLCLHFFQCEICISLISSCVLLTSRFSMEPLVIS